MDWAQSGNGEGRESLYTDILGDDWQEVEPGIFVHAERVEQQSRPLKPRVATAAPAPPTGKRRGRA